METSKNDEICVFTLIFITVSTTSVDVVCSALQHVHVFDDDDVPGTRYPVPLSGPEFPPRLSCTK